MGNIIKSIVKDIQYDGEIELGHQVMIGYFAQDEAEVDQNYLYLKL